MAPWEGEPEAVEEGVFGERGDFAGGSSNTSSSLKALSRRIRADPTPGGGATNICMKWKEKHGFCLSLVVHARYKIQCAIYGINTLRRDSTYGWKKFFCLRQIMHSVCVM